MAGTIVLAPDSRWSAAGWLFDWAVRFIAERVGQPEVATELQQVIDHNLGWVDVGALPPEVRRSVVDSLQRDLVPVAEIQLPATLPERERVVEHLGELADLARGLPYT